MPKSAKPTLDWPDRPGFWWFRHRWGMELAESYAHGDVEEDESPWAVRTHSGGVAEAEPLMPRDFVKGPRDFIWLAESFDQMKGVADG